MSRSRSLLAGTALFSLAALSVSARAHAACGTKPPDTLISTLVRQAPGLRADVLRMALAATDCASQRGLVTRRELITVLDYSLPSTEPRMFVFDLESRKLLFRELVAHGKNSGENVPRFFSNSHGSLATSIGLFVTGGTYVGGNGYSLRLRGLEPGINDQAWDRLIVMHGASYVSRAAIRALGRLGRSWGCPAVRQEVAREVIDTLKGGSPVFAYYPDKEWLTSSAFVAR